MKLKLSLILVIFCGVTCLAQPSDEKAVIAARQRILKKQILVDELDLDIFQDAPWIHDDDVYTKKEIEYEKIKRSGKAICLSRSAFCF